MDEVRWHRRSRYTPVLSSGRIGVFLCAYLLQNQTVNIWFESGNWKEICLTFACIFKMKERNTT